MIPRTSNGSDCSSVDSAVPSEITTQDSTSDDSDSVVDFSDLGQFLMDTFEGGLEPIEFAAL